MLNKLPQYDRATTSMLYLKCVCHLPHLRFACLHIMVFLGDLMRILSGEVFTQVKLVHGRARLECFSSFVFCTAYTHLCCAILAFRFHYLLFTQQIMQQLFALKKEKNVLYIQKKDVMKKWVYIIATKAVATPYFFVQIAAFAQLLHFRDC